MCVCVCVCVCVRVCVCASHWPEHPEAPHHEAHEEEDDADGHEVGRRVAPLEGQRLGVGHGEHRGRAHGLGGRNEGV